MSITLFTGVPGAGKTAAMVDLLSTLGNDRVIFAANVNGLSIPHQKLEDPKRWPELVPDGAIVVIDEVQEFWPPRGPSSAKPEWIAKLETHRHRGLDFYLTTQGPNLIDTNVRALVGRHIHIRNVGVLGRRWYEWPECATSPATAWKQAPINKRYRLPARVFDKYKSASIHTKQLRSIPAAVVVLGVAFLLAVPLIWYATTSILARTKPPADVPSAVSSPSSPSSAARALAPSHVQPAGPVDERVAFVPRLSGRPWTAPAYDHLRQVVAMPTITGAVCVDRACKCYHHNRVLPISSADCYTWATENPFSPYEADSLPSVPAAASPDAPAGTPASRQPAPHAAT